MQLKLASQIRRGILAVFLAGVVSLGAGCLVVPIPTNRVGEYSRKDIKPEVIESLAPGRATREEVLLQLGEPDEFHADGSEYRYHWERVKWDILWFVGAGNTGAGGDIPINKNHNLVINFDPAGVVSERKTSACFGESEHEKQIRPPP
jgi:outer membrane protein assembly factor BamE (lipoprotein component of BamABCDE complex)